MSDQNFHEIQLSGKQLAFLFMSAVVLAAVIFMLGVSVGRDVRSNAPQQTAGSVPTDTAVPAEPAAQGTPNDLSYGRALQGRSAPPPTASEPPSAPVSPPTPPADTKPAGAADTKPTAVSPPPTKPDTKPDTKPEANSGAAPASGNGFFLQVTSVSTEPAATSVVRSLKAKGFPATVIRGPENAPISYKVQVGPYATRAEAQRASTHLKKEGFSPFFLKR